MKVAKDVPGSWLKTFLNCYRTRSKYFLVQLLKWFPLPGGTVGYPAHPRLILSVCHMSVCHITFNYSAGNHPDPTDLVKY
jgi:hypothetical protein